MSLYLRTVAIAKRTVAITSATVATASTPPTCTQPSARAVPLLVTRSLSHPLGRNRRGVLRPAEQMLTRLIGAGFAPVTALHVHRAYIGCLDGHILTELQELVTDPDEAEDLLRRGLHRLPAREFPVLRSLASVLAGYDGAAELDRSLDTLLACLDLRLAAR